MKRRRSQFIFLLFIFLGCSVSEAEPQSTTIRLLNWWQYTPRAVLKKLNHEGFNVELDTYKSNNVAVAKLINHRRRYDIAILSNHVIPDVIKSGYVVQGLFKTDKVKRQYVPFLNKYASDCLPYLWGPTVFAVVPSSNGKFPTLNNLFDLFALERKGYKVGILDDKLEIYSRLRLDADDYCKRTGIEAAEGCIQKYINRFHPKLKSFKSTIADVLVGPGTAGYSWHGGIKDAISKKLDVDIQLPKGRIVAGYDGLCIVNNKMSAQKRDRLTEFIRQFTSYQMTEYSVEYTQYFSPYVGDTRGLIPQFANLKGKFEIRTKGSPPFVISPLTGENGQRVSNWWRKIRYEK